MSELPSSDRPYHPRALVRRGVVAVAGATLLAASVFVADRLTRTTVTLEVNGHSRQLHTRASTVRAVLDEAGIILDPEDSVSPPPDEKLVEGMTITVRKAKAVAVLVDGQVQHVRTQAVHPLDVLAEQGINLEATDRIQVNGYPYSADRLAQLTWQTPFTSIQVLRSKAVKVVDGETSQVIHTTQADVGRALDEAGIALHLADRITPDLAAPVTEGMVITIERSVPITVIADGHTLRTRAYGPTVGDALAQVGIAPLDLDITTPPEETPLAADMTIQVIRVREEVITKEAAIPFPILTEPGEGAAHIIQEGVEGLRRWQVRVIYEDEREVASEVVAEWIVRTPVPQIVAQGTTSQ